MIAAGRYKDLFCLTIDTGRLIASVLPDQGGKLASLTDKATGCQLLAQAAGASYRTIGLTSSYVEGECSAFDDMFPTIDPQPGGYPDHGEVCRVRHEYSVSDTEARLFCRSSLLPFEYEKRFFADAEGALVVDYRITNLSEAPLPCLWAGHIMLAGCEGGEVTVPYEEGAPIEVCFCDNGPLRAGQRLCFSRSLAVSQPFSSEGSAYKFYFTEPAREGRLRYSRRGNGPDLLIRYDADRLPYVGLWMNNGTFKGMYSAAVEMCTAPFDSPGKAEARGYPVDLPGGKSLLFRLSFSSVPGRTLP